jgi:hypothetical protein
MIIPSDQVLNGSVEYYDPSRRVVYLERDFWQKYFSMLLRDFSTEMGVQPTPLMKRRLASMVKDVLYDYWHTKFVQCKDFQSSLWKEINRCFMSIANINRNAVHEVLGAPYVQKQAAKADLIESVAFAESEEKTRNDGSEVVDELVNDYSQMEFDSLREIEMEAIVEEASRSYYNESLAIDRVKADYEKGRFGKYTNSAFSFSVISDMVFAEAESYREDKIMVGEITLWNLIDMSEVLSQCQAVLQDFTIARFNNFYKQYSRVLVFNRLVQRIGYDVCELIYRGFMRNMVFNYVNVYEYAFCTIFLCDFCKRSVFFRFKSQISKGFISMYRKTNVGLFEEKSSIVPSPFISSSIGSRSSKITNSKKNSSHDVFGSNEFSVVATGSKRDSIFSQDGGNYLSNSSSFGFLGGQK